MQHVMTVIVCFGISLKSDELEIGSSSIQSTMLSIFLAESSPLTRRNINSIAAISRKSGHQDNPDVGSSYDELHIMSSPT